MTADKTSDKEKINDMENELNIIKTKHKEESDHYIKKLKENDDMVREKIAEFDSDKKEFFNKLEELKENLKVTIESQINIEKSE